MDALILIGTVIFLAGAISILIPLKFLGIKSRSKGFIIAVIAFLAVGFAASQRDTNQNEKGESKALLSSSSTASKSAASLASQPPTPATLAGQRMTDNQRKFVGAIENARAAYNQGQNDMQKGAARPNRARELCSILTSVNVKDWVGQIATLSSNNEGKGVLSIKIAPDLYIKTWNNSVSDFADNTLLDPNSEIFSKSASLKKGEWVSFSGSFRRAETDCIKESSMSLGGSLKEPEFIFKFADISPIR